MIDPIGEFTNMTNQQIDETITLNTTFPSQLTHDLIPYLNHPALILNVSSYAGLLPPPYLTGSVNTGSDKKPVFFLRPSAVIYAKAILKIAVCGRQSIMPYLPHALQTNLISLLPQKLIGKATKNAQKKELEMKGSH